MTRILAPVSAGISCAAPTTTVGCRSLALVCATATGAQTDDPSGMVDYTGRIVAVDFTAADPAAGSAMRTTRVARYGYDATTGALTGEWDPRLSTPLVTRYSYSGGRLASWTPPGLNPFTFGYAADGKLLTVTRHDDALNQDAVTRTVYGVAWDTPADTNLPNLNGATTATWGQSTDLVAKASAVFPPDHPASATPATGDWQYATLHYLDASSREVDTANYGASAWQIDATQYDLNGNQFWSLTAGNRAQALTPTAQTDSTAAALSTAAERANVLPRWRHPHGCPPLQPRERKIFEHAPSQRRQRQQLLVPD